MYYVSSSDILVKVAIGKMQNKKKKQEWIRIQKHLKIQIWMRTIIQVIAWFRNDKMKYIMILRNKPNTANQ